MQGYFLVSSNDEHEKYDIKCELHPNFAKDEIPLDQMELYVEIEKINNIIKSLIKTDDKIKNKYFQKLLSLAQAGLVSEAAQPKLALMSLEKLKEEILLIEGQRIKNKYMQSLGVVAAILTIICYVLYIILDYNKLTDVNGYIFAFIGALIGAWVSFGARKFTLNFDELCVIEEDMMSPVIRLIYIGLCSMIFLLFLSSGIINIEIGSITTENVSNNIKLQVLVGIICGLVESKIGINIYNKAKTIIGEQV